MKRRCLMVLAWLGCAAALAAETATVVRPSALRVGRYVDSAEVGTLAEGTQVEVLQAEAGWLRVRAGARSGWLRASAVRGQGAAVALVATLEGGRNAAGNQVAAAGIRALPRSGRHALLIGVGDYDGSALPGVADDLAAAARAAAAMDVPAARVQVLRDADVSTPLLSEALHKLAQAVMPGDRVFVYFSGRAAAAACNGGWQLADGVSWPGATIARALQPLAQRADKLLVMADLQPAPDAACALQASPLAEALGAQQGGATVSVLEAVKRGAGSATQAWSACLNGEARDLDGSGGVTLDELSVCTSERLRQGGTPPQLALSGNRAYIPSAVTPRHMDVIPVKAAALAMLRDILAQRDPRRVVTLQASAARLRIGEDGMALQLTSSQAGYVYLLLQGSDQKGLHLLFPNALDQSNRIAAGETLQLPRSAWRIVAQGPAGTDRLLALVTDAPRDIAALGGQDDGPFLQTQLDPEGRVALQQLIAHAANGSGAQCQNGAPTGPAAAPRLCSDAYGAALLELEEY